MVDWRTRASALLPELSAVVERESWSCHVFLSELWQLALDAHRAAVGVLLGLGEVTKAVGVVAGHLDLERMPPARADDRQRLEGLRLRARVTTPLAS